MKKVLSLILALVTVLSFLLTFFACDNSSTDDSPKGGESIYHNYYLANASVGKKSYGTNEKIKVTIDLSDCNDGDLGFESIVFSITAENFLITNNYSESGEGELEHTYSSDAASNVTPDSDSVFLEYKGIGKTYGKILFKARPTTDVKAAKAIKLYTECTLYYAVSESEITFFESEEDAIEKSKNSSFSATDSEDSVKGVFGGIMHYYVSDHPFTYVLSDNPFSEQAYEIDYSKNAEYTFLAAPAPFSTTYLIESTEYCFDDLFIPAFDVNEIASVTDSNTIKIFLSQDSNLDICFSSAERRKYDITISPIITPIESLGTTTVKNANLGFSNVRGDTLVEFTPEESGFYDVSHNLRCVFYETEEGFGQAEPFNQSGEFKKIKLEGGRRYIFALDFQADQAEFTITPER